MNITTAKQLCERIGKMIKWEEHSGTYAYLCSGIVTNIIGQNVEVDGDWKWMPDMYNLRLADELGEHILNGNKFEKDEHIFIKGHGCFYPAYSTAKNKAFDPNGVRMWTKTIAHEGEKWFQCGYSNVHD